MKTLNDLSDNDIDNFIQFVREQEIRLCQNSFWHFCKTLEPDFYQDHRWHLQLICDVLQGIYEGTLINPETGKAYKKLMMSIPPRHGKSRTLVNFSRWLFGKDTKNKVITASYNDEMAVEFSRFTRDGIRDRKTYPHEIDYSDIFPNVTIKQGNASFHQWALEGEFFNYKGVGLGGGITGKGCTIGICDDLVKDSATAYNPMALKKIWDWYTGTFLSRIERGGIQIMNMTRWSKNDPIGKIRQTKAFKDWYVLDLSVIDKNGNLLCPDIFDMDMYEFASNPENFDPVIFSANYRQIPVDLKGALYKKFKIYERHKFKNKFEKIVCWVDTADRGNNYLSAIIFGIYQGQAYIIDIYYTQDDMDITEPELAKRLFESKCQECYVESNNGGRGFKRNVERILWETYNTRSVYMQDIAQRDNKEARILTNATNVQNNIYYPENWEQDYSDFARDLKSYQAKGKNDVDDGPDNVTQVAEHLEKGIDDGVSNW